MGRKPGDKDIDHLLSSRFPESQETFLESLLHPTCSPTPPQPLFLGYFLRSGYILSLSVCPFLSALSMWGSDHHCVHLSFGVSVLFVLLCLSCCQPSATSPTPTIYLFSLSTPLYLICSVPIQTFLPLSLSSSFLSSFPSLLPLSWSIKDIFLVALIHSNH